MSKVMQLLAAIAPHGFALPKHLNLMSSDARNRARCAGLIFTDPDEATSHCGIHDDAPRIDLLRKEDRRAVARERHRLFRCGAFAAARVRRPSIQNIRERYSDRVPPGPNTRTLKHPVAWSVPPPLQLSVSPMTLPSSVARLLHTAG
jgi:hypothetical protein